MKNFKKERDEINWRQKAGDISTHHERKGEESHKNKQ